MSARGKILMDVYVVMNMVVDWRRQEALVGTWSPLDVQEMMESHLLMSSQKILPVAIGSCHRVTQLHWSAGHL